MANRKAREFIKNASRSEVQKAIEALAPKFIDAASDAMGKRAAEAWFDQASQEVLALTEEKK